MTQHLVFHVLRFTFSAMRIGIDASRAFLKNRTGIEEYSYQVIRHLTNYLKNDQVVLYVRKNQKVDFELPDNWKIKVIKWPYLWTQVGLSLELLWYPVNLLFVPAHTVPLIHPACNASLFNLALAIQKLLKALGVSTYYNQYSVAGGPKNTVVTIHGLEYEFCPKAYSFWARTYMRWSIINSCRWAKKIIAVSENTKKDLIKLYKVPEEKIKVIYEGYDRNFQFPISNFQKNSKFQIPNSKFLLFIGRLEERKNIIGIIKAFKILKEQYKIPHKLILAGKFGHGADKIRYALRVTSHAKDIILPGYVSEEEKWELLKNTDVFLFPTFYEGFGIPILEAQSVGAPVVAGDNSSTSEVTYLGAQLPSAVLVNPHNAEQIADAAYKLISDKNFRNDTIKKGLENVGRFSWEKCANEVAKIIKNECK